MLRSVFFTALLALSASATAQDFDYNYLSFGYERVTLDAGSVDVDGDGLGLNGSFEIGESFFVFGGYGVAEFEEQGNTLDADTLNIGLGWHTSLSDDVDLVTGLSYEYIDLSSQGSSFDDNGIGLGVGLRFAASDNIEVNGGVDYVDYSDGGDDTTFGLGFLYGVSDSFDIGLNGEWGDDSSAYGINGRFYFGN